jgi:hypothetical protein
LAHGNPEIDESGIKTWHLDVRSGTKTWYLDGRRHRTDGPAVEYTDGSKTWWVNGDRHRADGPACEWADGDLWWCLNDRHYSFDVWLKVNTALTDGEKLMMKLQYG